MYPDLVFWLWYTSFFGLLAIGIVVAFVKSNVCCSAPAKDNKRCCSRDPTWSFVAVPKQCDADGCLFALGIMALLSALLQAIVFLFMRVKLITIYLLIAYNFVNWGWPLSIWAGRYWKAIQAVCVGAGSGVMWAASIYETVMLALGDPAPDTHISLSILYALSICSLVDFMLYVVYPYCWCCGVRIDETSLKNTFLDNKTNEPVPMYTIGSDEENDITSNA